MKNIRILNDLSSRLGLADTVELLIFALPLIRERRQELSDALLSQDWGRVHRCAYKTLGSVRIYGSETLEELLLSVPVIQEKSRVEIEEFRGRLFTEMEDVIQGIEYWLEQHDPSSQDKAGHSGFFSLNKAGDGSAKQPKCY